MSEWEERMAAKHAHGMPEKDWIELRRRNAEEFPQDLAEQRVPEYCRGEGPPYCAEARPDGDSGRWMAFVVCGGSVAKCVHGHQHHQDEVWMATSS